MSITKQAGDARAQAKQAIAAAGVDVIHQASLTAHFALLGCPWLARSTAAQAALDAELQQALHCWQAKAGSVTSNPPRLAQADGEIIGKGAIQGGVLPQALKVFVPDLPNK
ncbi:MAG: hypothetical protein KF832_08095 [Caldilineaceae bacterium]|nr:hypothetical protein [Caldilineaceae bacterium]